MKHQLILLLFVILGCSAVSYSQTRSNDYVPLTRAQIEEIKQQRLEMYRIEGDRKDAAAKRFLLNQAMKLNANQANYDVRYYGIHLSLNFTSQTVNGYVDYRLKSLVGGLTAIDLDLHSQLTVDSVKVNNSLSSFSHLGEVLAITAPSPIGINSEFTMQVFYHGPPYSGLGYTNGGMAFMFNGGDEVCWTACEPFDSRNWWPCKDTPEDKADSLDLYIQCPTAYDVASNGVLISNTDIGGGRKIAHWKHKYPITTYLVAVTCADFDITTKTWNYGGHSMPVYAYNFPNAYASKAVFDTLTIPMLNIYSDAFGIYPFVNEKLANANCGIWGTMEHQTCSFHDPFAAGYDRVYLLIHENAHQWWGDMITCKTFNHIWLNEGFGTYSESIFYERKFGKQAYFDHIQTQEYMGAGTIYVEDPLHENIFDGGLSYNKGAWVLHMLRGVIGDSLFFQSLRNWAFSSFRYGSATTEDFAASVSSTVGSDMTWYFQQWIYGNGHPDYQVSWLCTRDTVNGGYLLDYFVQQAQSFGQLFGMPLKMQFVTTTGTKDTTLWNDEETHLYTLHFADSVTNVLTDPQQWILRTVTKVPFGMHVAASTLPEGHVGEPYTYRLRGVGGLAPYRWMLWGGDLPIGVTFEEDTVGVLNGVPTYAASYYFTVRLTDSKNPPDSVWQDITLRIVNTPSAVCGDADGSTNVDVSDAVYLIAYIFGGGPAPSPIITGDPDCTGGIDISDVVYLVNYIFGGGPLPCAACK